MKTSPIPLQEYLNDLSGNAWNPYLTGNPTTMPDSEEVEAIQRATWEKFRKQATSGAVKVRAFRHVSKPEPRSSYPRFAESNVAEEIPPTFFEDNDVYFSGMPKWVLFYRTRPSVGGVVNAPWIDPVVVSLSHEHRSPSSGELERWFREYEKKNPNATREDDAKAASAHFGFPVKREALRSLRGPRKLGRRPRRISE